MSLRNRYEDAVIALNTDESIEKPLIIVVFSIVTTLCLIAAVFLSLTAKPPAPTPVTITDEAVTMTSGPVALGTTNTGVTVLVPGGDWVVGQTVNLYPAAGDVPEPFYSVNAPDTIPLIGALAVGALISLTVSVIILILILILAEQAYSRVKRRQAESDRLLDIVLS